MKTPFATCIVLFLVLAAAGQVESRRHRDDRRQQGYKMFVFGDSFVDNGNTDKEELTWWTRNWYRPYGVSDSNHKNKPTGRFSDGKVQSDFIAAILGHDESPAPENMRQDGVDPFGMNFAVGFGDAQGGNSSDFEAQVGRFRKLLKHGQIDTDLSQSVALVAFSGYDYTDIPDQKTDHEGFVSFIDDVVASIADGVSDILELGVTKVLVNLMQPMGCSPRYTRSIGYDHCIEDEVTELHNKKMKEKLGRKDAVLLLDLYTAFTSTIHPRSGTGFEHRHIPCCDSKEDDGYCGQVDDDGVKQFEVCDDPEGYFYFDEWHPTEAGWKAIVDKLEDPIKEFLNISSSS